MNLREVALQCIEIYDSHNYAAECDAGFDGGEFSSPAHARAADKEVEELAVKNGFTYDEVQNEINRICNELEIDYDRLGNYE